MESYFGVVECLNAPSSLPKEQGDRLEANIALALAHHARTGEHVVPLRAECLTKMEHWAGSANIRRSFLAHYSRNPVPGVGRRILTGAIMPDGSVFGGGHSAPVAPSPSQPKLEPATAPAVAKLSPKKAAAAIAKAKKVIAKGADRAAVIAHLLTFGIENAEI